LAGHVAKTFQGCEDCATVECFEMVTVGLDLAFELRDWILFFS